MVLSSSEHDDLIRRVERLVKHRGIDRAVVAGAVERVLGRLAAASVEPEAITHTVVVMAESMPDLASRMRSALQSQATFRDMAIATEGRHTVLVGRVAAPEIDAVCEAAGRLGVGLVDRGIST
jgi:hypothetical protein